jgi:hypothetical protein
MAKKKTTTTTTKKKGFTATVVKPTATSDEGTPTGVNLDNFFSLMNKTGAKYIFAPCRDFWPASSVNARIPPVVLLDANGQPLVDSDGKIVKLSANKWLDKYRPIEGMTWAPGLPMQISDRLITLGGWIKRQGVSCFNLYRPPRIKLGDASKAQFWLDHVHRIYPNDAAHIVAFNAHAVQRPEDKINHALVLAGAPGIGKDSLMEAVKEAVGEWNFQEIAPKDMFAPFNGFAKAVVLRINEAHDLGDSDRFTFYQRTKTYLVVPPKVMRINEKYIPEHYIPNVCHVVITTNHKTDGLYLPADDRRTYVAWSDAEKEDFPPDYWNEFWGNYRNGGFENVAAYLHSYDLSHFDPKAPPPKTAAFWEIVNVGLPPEDAELADLIDTLGKRDEKGTLIAAVKALTIPDLIAVAQGEISDWIANRGNRKSLPHRLARCGYTVVPNPDRPKDGLWKYNGARTAIYARTDLSAATRLKAAEKKAQS